jgi:hypothetical protein
MNKSIINRDSRNLCPEETTVSLRVLDRNLRGERENLPKLHSHRMILMF